MPRIMEMKKYLLIISMLFMSNTYAHDGWDGDAWAKEQIKLTDELTKCANFLDRSYGLFFELCKMKSLYSRLEKSSNEYTQELKKHPTDTLMLYFVADHFKDKELGFSAVGAIYSMIDALAFIDYKMKLLRPPAQPTEEDVLSKDDIQA